MKADDLQYLLLFLSAGTVLLALSQIGYERRVSRGRSWFAFTLGVALFAAAFGGAIISGSHAVLLVIQALAMCAIAVGFVVFSSETRTIEQVAKEQRVDFHTGLPNKRAFTERLVGEHSRTKRTGRSYAVAVYEIDNYDDLSDDDKNNGMKLLAKTLDEAVRNTDAIARISERHVVVMMVDTEAVGGVVGCERARDKFFFRSCSHDESAPVTRPLTASVGIAAFDHSTAESFDVIRNAELALYRMRVEKVEGTRVYSLDDYDRPLDNLVHSL